MTSKSLQPPPQAEDFPQLKILYESYRALDAEVALTAARSGLACLPGCSRCCARPASQVEATVLEMLPAALDLWAQGRAETALRTANNAGGESPCIIYDSARAATGAGGCGMYDRRPLVCRLFGFAGLRNKYGRPGFAYCGVMKTIPNLIRGADKALEGGLMPPDFSHWMSRIQGMDPYWATDSLPINVALARAIEIVGLRKRFGRRQGRSDGAGHGRTETDPPEGRSA